MEELALSLFVGLASFDRFGVHRLYYCSVFFFKKFFSEHSSILYS